MYIATVMLYTITILSSTFGGDFDSAVWWDFIMYINCQTEVTADIILREHCGIYYGSPYPKHQAKCSSTCAHRQLPNHLYQCTTPIVYQLLT